MDDDKKFGIYSKLFGESTPSWWKKRKEIVFKKTSPAIDLEEIYRVDDDFSKSMFASLPIGTPGANTGEWLDMTATYVATFQGHPTTGVRAYQWEPNPSNPSTSSPWHNVLYENCIGPYKWGARAFQLYFPFGSSEETFFLSPEIWKRSFIEYNEANDSHDQPAIWKGFKYAVKALLEGTLTPPNTDREGIKHPCNVMIYHPTNRGDSPYRTKSNALWDSFAGSSTSKDEQYYVYLDAWIDELIAIKSNVADAGRLHVTLDGVNSSATPANIVHWRTMPDYRSDLLELADWYVFNRLLLAGVAVFYDSRSITNRRSATVPGSGSSHTVDNPGQSLPVEWAGKAFASEEYWFWYSNPTHPEENVKFADYATDEVAPMVFRPMMSNFPLPPEQDPYGVSITITSNNKTKTLTLEDLTVFTPQYAMWSYYTLSDHYRYQYNINTESETFTGISARVKNIVSYSPETFSSIDLCISFYGEPNQELVQYHMLPSSVIHYRPMFNDGVDVGEWNHVAGVTGYVGGFWVQSGMNKWDNDVRDATFPGFINKLHNYSLVIGPNRFSSGWKGTSYGSVGDELTNGVLVMNTNYTDIWAASWLATDPTINLSGQQTHPTTPEVLGDVNSFRYVKPMIHIADCIADGGYRLGTTTAFINETSGCPGRFSLITPKILELPVGKRALRMQRYDNGDYFEEEGDKYPNYPSGGRSVWGDVAGLTVAADWTVLATELKSRGCLPDYIILDGPPSEGNPFSFFSGITAGNITNIINDPRAALPWYDSPSFNSLYTNGGTTNGGATANFDAIFAGAFHPQSNKRYLYWNKAVSGIMSEFLNKFIGEPTFQIFGITKITNLDSIIADENTLIYDNWGHPTLSEVLIGDANCPILYGSSSNFGPHGVWNNDTTQLVRTDWADDGNGGSTIFADTAWNQFLQIVQTLRGLKRKSPNIPLRPWFAPINWWGGGAGSVANPRWMQDGLEGLGWESLRHMLISGSEMIHYFNYHDGDTGTSTQRTQNNNKLESVMQEVNGRIGGYVLHATNIARVDYKANYIISGSPYGGGFVWRLTRKPGVTLFAAGNVVGPWDYDGGMWITTATSTPPVFATGAILPSIPPVFYT